MLANSLRTASKRLAPASARVLTQTEQLTRGFAAPAQPAAEEDEVLAAFRESQQQYQQLMQGLQSINLPLTGDDAAIKKYAAEVEALKKKIGMPDVEEVISAELDYKLACTGYNVRLFVVDVLSTMMDGGSMEAAKAELLTALDEAERQSGGELSGSNDKGWEILTRKLGEIEKKYGLADKSKVRDEAIFEMYKSHIHQLRDTVVADINKARDEDVADIQPNLAALKPKLT
ncbi:hypothetical protein COHA_006043 [Chlorella ohadii]|uniref:Uncharacterized protein n=1 Tax=Chlorella ohadii TaxID=2649997 RepID=A0AAD5H1A3_9CHLO|nr:hypothetical protein COHA_006043 [Chlorella ohadii]